MDGKKYVLGVDTSNYKTSLAVLNREKIICDLRQFLKVRQGERGLRQSDALFQHVKNLPVLSEKLNAEFMGRISAVAYSSRPRPVKDSYMPCFLAGESYAKSIASYLGVPAIAFSHQEGHIEAIRAYSEMKYVDEFIACHFSGGTCEVLKVKPAAHKRVRNLNEAGFCCVNGENVFFDIEICGGSRDISFGQVLDRAGVLMGFGFPAGQELDDIACATAASTHMLTPIKVNDCEINLSGIDTQIKNMLENMSKGVPVSSLDDSVKAELIREIMEKLSDAMKKMLRQASEKTGIKDIIMSGGVSTSRFMREHISDELESEGIIVYFDDLGLSSDNAVGTALLGGEYIWD